MRGAPHPVDGGRPRPPTYLCAFVSVSYHWNNFLWPLVIELGRDAAAHGRAGDLRGAESGVDWSIITAGTLIVVGPLLVAFLLFQRQFVQSFMHAGIK